MGLLTAEEIKHVLDFDEVSQIVLFNGVQIAVGPHI
jgi:hypothetical protein